MILSFNKLWSNGISTTNSYPDFRWAEILPPHTQGRSYTTGICSALLGSIVPENGDKSAENTSVFL